MGMMDNLKGNRKNKEAKTSPKIQSPKKLKNSGKGGGALALLSAIAGSSMGALITETDEIKAPKTFHERLFEIPTYAVSISNIQNLYSTIKGRNRPLKSALTASEDCAELLLALATPALKAVTESAFIIGKPIIGEVKDPVGKIDSVASEVLAKLQENAPIIKEPPSKIIKVTIETAKDGVDYVIYRVQTNGIVQETLKRLDNVISVSELIVEVCLPTDSRDLEEVLETQRAEKDENKGLIKRTLNLKSKVVRRGTKKLLTYRPVRMAADTVLYTHSQITDVTEKMIAGLEFLDGKKNEATAAIMEAYPDVRRNVEVAMTDGASAVVRKCDVVFQATMFIPKKAIQLTGEVYISAHDMVFAFGKAHSIIEAPHLFVEKIEKYYNELRKESPTVGEIQSKALAFVFVPTQVIKNYLVTSKIVHWALPAGYHDGDIKLMNMDEHEKIN